MVSGQKKSEGVEVGANGPDLIFQNSSNCWGVAISSTCLVFR
jgi:hypothetical protein